MHELSLCYELVSQVQGIASEHPNCKVLSVKVEIGSWSGVERHALEFAYPVAARNTILDGVALEIDERPLKLRCKSCAAEICPDPPAMYCESCESFNVEIIEGKEFLLKEVELCA